MTTDPRDTLAAIRARADAATEGPWDAEPLEGNIVSPTHGNVIEVLLWTDADAEFIAAARQDIPALLAFAEAILDLADPDYPPPPPDERGAAGWRFAMEHIRALAAEHLTEEDQ